VTGFLSLVNCNSEEAPVVRSETLSSNPPPALGTGEDASNFLFTWNWHRLMQHNVKKTTLSCPQLSVKAIKTQDVSPSTNLPLQ